MNVLNRNLKHMAAFPFGLALLCLLPSCATSAGISGHGSAARPGGAAAGPDSPAAHSPRAPAFPAEWKHAICDRVEDCAVERNEALARSYGGTDEDVKLSRMEARQALASGVVRRWCDLQVGHMTRSNVERIHECLSHKRSCLPFYQCAAFPARSALRP